MLGVVFPVELYISCHQNVIFSKKLLTYKKVSLRIYMIILSILGFSAATMSLLKSFGAIHI